MAPLPSLLRRSNSLKDKKEMLMLCLLACCMKGVFIATCNYIYLQNKCIYYMMRCLLACYVKGVFMATCNLIFAGISVLYLLFRQNMDSANYM